jgi:hypothetical protein
MTYIKIGETLCPATISGVLNDRSWGGRDSKAITLEMDYATALALFVDDLDWSIVFQPDSYPDPETGETVTPEAEIYDNSGYSVAGPITDNRDGTVTVKMGKPTDAEMLAELMEVLNND